MSKLKEKEGSIHFMGILGSGCYPLAEMLFRRGYKVTGTDIAADTENDTSPVEIPIWHSLKALPEDTSMVIYSLAVKDTDPLISDAKKREIPLISRAQLLGALMSQYPIRIAVSGSHGKSTTTALVEHILRVAAVPHTAVSGAKLATGKSYTDCGGDVFVAEACEYKDSFLSIPATHQIITSVELDHTDYFCDEEAILHSFFVAASRAENVILNIDDPLTSRIYEMLSELKNDTKFDTSSHLLTESTVKMPSKVVSYGKDEKADFKIRSIVRNGEFTHFSLTFGGETLNLTTSLMGEFNLFNIAAAVTVAHTLGIDFTSISEAVSTFRTIERRLSLLTYIDNTPVFYDYAHHPSEISAVICALRERYGTVTLIFRPHTFSRTKSLWSQFVNSLSMADRVVLLDIYPAREDAIDGVNSYRLAEEIPSAVYCAETSDAVRLATCEPSGAVALVGAGEVEDIKKALLKKGKHG